MSSHERNARSLRHTPPPGVAFELDGEQVEARPGETHLGGRAPRSAPTSRISATRRIPATGRTAIAAPAWSRSRASACSRPPASACPAVGMKVHRRRRERAVKARAMVHGAARRRPAGARDLARPGLAFLAPGRPRPASPRAASRPPSAGSADRQPSGHARQSRRLHPVQSLRPRLPRGPGQRRHRHGLPLGRRQDGVRLRRPDGPVDLRRLRRMRPGLPDRRADAGGLSRRRTRPARSIPTARSTASAPIAASAARSPTRSRTRRSSTPRAATARPTTTGSASRAASASTTSTTRTG